MSPRQVRLIACNLLAPGLSLLATGPGKAILESTGFSLIPYVQKIDLYESIFDNTMSGSITLLESMGLAEYLPIVGVETILIAFAVSDAAGVERTFVHAFRVTRVGDITYPRHDFRLYTLHLATHEFVRSISKRISRSFSNTRCDQAVKDILVKDLQVDPALIATMEPTWSTVDIVIPFYTPLRAINYFTVLAQTDTPQRESNFLFFETLDGFHFTSISKLIRDGQQRPLRVFRVDAGQLSTANTVDASVAFNAITRVHQEQTFDLLHDIASGMLRSKMVHFDFLARKLDPDMDSRYTDSFEKTTHLDRHPVYPKNFDGAVSKNVRIFMVPSNAWSKGSSYVKQKADELPEQRMHEAIMMRNRQIKELSHLKTLIDLPGQPDLRAGSVVVVNYPSSRPLEGKDVNINTPVYSEGTPYYSGKHLVTHVHHILTSRGGEGMQYRMNIKVVKDSLGAPLIGTTHRGE